MQLKHIQQVSADASFHVVALGLLSDDEQVSYLLPELKSGWMALVGSNWKSKISLLSVSKTQRRCLSEI